MTLARFKPHLSATYEKGVLDFSKGWLLSAKYDGIRAVNLDGTGLVSRSLKPIPNKVAQERFGGPLFQYMDGELIIGEPFAKDVFNVTTSGVRKADADVDVKYYVFDYFKDPLAPAYVRQTHLLAAVTALPPELRKHVVMVVQNRIDSEYAFVKMTDELIELGYEGSMLKRPDAPYKFGRSTIGEKDQALVKVKFRESSEARILAVEPEMENTNEATTNELGRTQRSSHAEGKVAKEKVGRFFVEDVKEGSPTFGMKFYVGVMRNVKAAQKEEWWADRESLVDQYITYDYMPIGTIDAPRQPVLEGAKGIRADFDMGSPE